MPATLLAFIPSDQAPWPYTLPGEATAVAWLQSLGHGPGSRIGLAGLNRAATAQVLLAGLRLGLEMVLFNRRLTKPELEAQLTHAGITRLVAHPEHPVAHLRPTDLLPDAFPPSPGTAPPAASPTPSAGGGLILFTSGTEGLPKAAVLPLPALLASAQAAVQVLELQATDTWACPLPLDHIGGVQCILRAALSGCRVHLGEGLDGCTGISLVPTQLLRLMEGRSAWPTGLRRILVGGGPLDPTLSARCAALGLPASQTYGLTEMGSMVTVLDPADWATHPNSAGRAVPRAQVRINADGQIEVAGPMRFAGYLGQEPTSDWFTTGDLGELSPDGFLTIHGRSTDLIVSGGENVYPAEVEAVIRQHPAVADCGVYGMPDAEWGQVIIAVVVLRYPYPTEKFATFANTRLASFKRPKYWRFVNTLPLNQLGKIERRRLGCSY